MPTDHVSLGHLCASIPSCRSWSGYEDELGWGALWLHKATGDKAYLNKALEFRPSWNEGLFSWDDKRAGFLVRLHSSRQNYLLQQFIRKSQFYVYRKGVHGCVVKPKYRIYRARGQELWVVKFHTTLQWRHNEHDGVTIVCPTVYSGANQRNHQSSASLAFVRVIHRWPVNSPHKWPVKRKMFPKQVMFAYERQRSVTFQIFMICIHFRIIHAYIYWFTVVFSGVS